MTYNLETTVGNLESLQEARSRRGLGEKKEKPLMLPYFINCCKRLHDRSHLLIVVELVVRNDVWLPSLKLPRNGSWARMT
jgi:hypothetical protein